MYKSFLIYVFVIVFFTSCVNNSSVFKKDEFTDFEKLTNKLVYDMHEEINYVLPKSNNLLYVTDFVNIKNLNVTSQLGLFLASDIKSHVTSKFHAKIKEITYSKNIKIDQSGIVGLSRELSELNDANVKKTYILVGTYALTTKQLIVYLNLVNMKNGEILKSTSSRVEMNDEILKLELAKPYNRLRPRLVL